MRIALLLTVAATLACSKAPLDSAGNLREAQNPDGVGRGADPRTRGGPGEPVSLFDETADQPTCSVLASAPDLVLAVERHVLSDLAGVGEYVERGEVTVNRRCDSKKPCQQISPEAMTKLVARLHAMGTIHHAAKHSVSPHYGFRRIEARWSGGECTFSDGVFGVIEERDHDKFYAMFDAIADIYLKAEAARDAGSALRAR